MWESLKNNAQDSCVRLSTATATVKALYSPLEHPEGNR